MANEQHSLATYVSDMLALEYHVRVPFDIQADDKDFREFSDASALAARLSETADAHVEALKKELERLGGHSASPVKNAVGEVQGVVAAAFDLFRKTKVSKALRDDFEALALCNAAYTLLLTTANALGDGTTAQLAQKHLEEYARLAMDIGEALPSIVVPELIELGLEVDTATIATSRGSIAKAWKSSADKPVRSVQGSVDANDYYDDESMTLME